MSAATRSAPRRYGDHPIATASGAYMAVSVLLAIVFALVMFSAWTASGSAVGIERAMHVRRAWTYLGLTVGVMFQAFIVEAVATWMLDMLRAVQALAPERRP